MHHTVRTFSISYNKTHKLGFLNLNHSWSHFPAFLFTLCTQCHSHCRISRIKYDSHFIT